MNIHSAAFLLAIVVHPTLTMAKECSALVLYDDSKALFKEWRVKEREISIGKYNLTLMQDWNSHGVAGVLWDSSVVLTKYLLDEDQIKDRRILELGAGIGLPTIVATKAGATSVVTTDIPSALPHLEQNIKFNLSPEEQTKVDIRELQWGNPSPSLPSFDLILGADLVYRKEFFEALKQTLISVNSPTTVTYMASKIRYPKDREFYRSLSDSFTVQKVHYDVETDVRVYKIVMKLK